LGFLGAALDADNLSDPALPGCDLLGRPSTVARPCDRPGSVGDVLSRLPARPGQAARERGFTKAQINALAKAIETELQRCCAEWEWIHGDF
jgi:hypothetical protein